MTDITISKKVLRDLTAYSQALVGINRRKKDAEADYQKVRGALFGTIDKLAGKESKLSVEIEETGHRIGRTIAHGSPTIDPDALREAVGDDLFTRVTTQTITYSIDYEALRDALRDEEITHSQIEKAIIPGRITERIIHSKIGSKEDVELAPVKSPVEELLEF